MSGANAIFSPLATGADFRSNRNFRRQGRPAVSGKRTRLRGLDYETNGLKLQPTASDAIGFSGGFNASYTYGFNAAGRITDWNGDGPQWNYQYDSAGRLTQATHGSEAFGYAYDAVGNRTSNGGQYNADNQLLENAESSFAYDTRGNLIGKTDKETGAHVDYSWNARGQLVEVKYYEDGGVTKTLRYAYGPLGRRWQKTENGTTRQFVYAGADRIATLDAGGNLLTRVTFAPGIDRPLGSTGNLDVYYHANHQGSVIALTGPSGAVLTEYSYSPFGKTTVSAARTNAFAYTGRVREAKNLYYYRARYYDPSVGRFISEDPIGFASGTTNLYVYVGNDPVNWVDPNGRFAVAIPAIVTGIVGAISGGVGAAIQGGNVFVGASIGAAVGAAGGVTVALAPVGVVWEFIIGGIASTTANLSGQALTSNGPLNYRSALISGIGGGFAAGPSVALRLLGPRVPGFSAQLGAGIIGLKFDVTASAIAAAIGAYQTERHSGGMAASSGLPSCRASWPMRRKQSK